MDERVARLRTPEDCEQFAVNVEAKGLHELAIEARRRAVELRAAARGAKTDAEREAFEAVYAYERALCEERGRQVKASRTWQMIARLGIIPAVEKVVRRKVTTQGYRQYSR